MTEQERKEMNARRIAKGKATRSKRQEEYAKRGEWFVSANHVPSVVTNRVLFDFIDQNGKKMLKKYGHYLRPSWCTPVRWRMFAAYCRNPERYLNAEPNTARKVIFR